MLSLTKKKTESILNYMSTYQITDINYDPFPDLHSPSVYHNHQLRTPHQKKKKTWTISHTPSPPPPRTKNPMRMIPARTARSVRVVWCRAPVFRRARRDRRACVRVRACANRRWPSYDARSPWSRRCARRKTSPPTRTCPPNSSVAFARPRLADCERALLRS